MTLFGVEVLDLMLFPVGVDELDLTLNVDITEWPLRPKTAICLHIDRSQELLMDTLAPRNTQIWDPDLMVNSSDPSSGVTSAPANEYVPFNCIIKYQIEPI
jgi:hypothetical protein